jgi:hypothetical protein
VLRLKKFEERTFAKGVHGSRLAAAEVARIQAAVADSMLFAEPCEEALET